MALLMAVELTVAVIISYYLCFYVSSLYHFSMQSIAGLWGAISAIFILSPKRSDVFDSTRNRALGTLVGATVPCALVYIFGGYPIYVLALSLFVTVILVSLLHIQPTYKIACITVVVVFIVGALPQQHYVAPWLNALSRLVESLIGVVVSLIIDMAAYPIRQHYDLF
jgi:uncharacterized membrane protein YgaE (UPF0421/DUF939 family)